MSLKDTPNQYAEYWKGLYYPHHKRRDVWLEYSTKYIYNSVESRACNCSSFCIILRNYELTGFF